MPSPASLHGKTLLASLVLVLFGGAMTAALRGDELGGVSKRMVVEHGASFGLGVAIGDNAETRFVEIGNQGAAAIHVALPEEWRRAEVRNVPLSQVTKSEPGLGYVRWTLPAGAAVSFRSANDWSSLSVENPSGIPFKILLTTVDIRTGRTEKNVVLVKDAKVSIP